MAHVDMSHDTLTGFNTPSEELQTYLNLRKYCIGSDIPVTYIPTPHNVFRALPAFFRFIVDTETRKQTIDCVRRVGFPDRDKSLRFRDLPSANSLTKAQATDAFHTVRAYLKPRNPALWKMVRRRIRQPPTQTNADIVDPGNQAPTASADGQVLSSDIVLPYCVLDMRQRALYIAEDIVFEGPDAAAIRLALSLDHLWHAGSDQQIILRRSTTNTVYHRIGGRWVTIGNTGTCQDRGYDTEAQEYESECINLERLRWAREPALNANRAPNGERTSADNALPSEDHTLAMFYPWYIIPPETRVYSERRLRTYNRPQTITSRHTAIDAPFEGRPLMECMRRYINRVNNDVHRQADGHGTSDSTPHSPWIRRIAHRVVMAYIFRRSIRDSVGS